MRVSRLFKSAVALSIVTFLAACGGGGSSSGCQAGNPGCTLVPETISVLAVDGVWLGASLELFDLQDFLDAANGGPSAVSLIDPVTTDATTGLAEDILVSVNAGPGPFIVVARGSAATDSTTGVAPVIHTMTRIVTLAELQAGTRIYVTPFTTLGTERARALALPSTAAAAVLARRDGTSDPVLQLFGFGINPGQNPGNTVDIYTTPAAVDETTTDLAAQQDVAAHRAALETFAEVVEEAAAAAGVSGDDVMEAIVTGFDLIIDGGTGPTPGSTLEDVVDEADTVDPNYLTNQGRFPGGVTDIEGLLGDDPTGLGTVLAGANAAPAAPDFDGDGVDNATDAAPYNSAVGSDADGDGIDDASDNCPAVPNNDQANLDFDAFGNVCDNDADGDGADGDGSGGPSATDIDDLNDDIAVDTDGDGWDDNGGGTFNPFHPGGANSPDNCVENKVLFGPTSPFFGLVPSIPQFSLTAVQAANAGQEDMDGDGEGDVCDEDADGDSAPGDGLSGPGNGALQFAAAGDPDDTDPANSPTDADADGEPNVSDNCPNTSNGPASTPPAVNEQGVANTNTTTNANGSVFGPSCDADDDGFPDTAAEDLAGITDIADGIAVDNCPAIANPDAGQFAQTDDVDTDGFGDPCDTDSDNDGLDDSVDPDPLNATGDYHFDLFYTQQSADASNFKLATISESVLTTLGAVAGGTNVLSLTNSGTNDTGGAGTGTLDVATGFETIDTAVSLNNNGGAAPCDGGGGPGCLAAATPTAGGGTAINAVDPAADAVTYALPNLTSDVDSGSIAHWGTSSFVGSGRFALETVGSTFATSAEQGLAVLQYTDGASNNADLNGQYGFVDLQISYGSGAGTAGGLVSTTSRVFDATFDGAGAITANGPLDQFVVSVGPSEGTVSYSSTGLGLTGYTVAANGATDIDTGTLFAIADAAGEVLTLGGSANRRGYGVRLGSFASANAAAAAAEATYDLSGIVMQPGRARVLAYDLDGATLSISDQGDGTVLATIGLTNTADRDASVLDAEDDALPSVTTEAPPQGIVSEPFAIGTDGRFGPVQFGAGTNLRAFDMEGFFVQGRGLLVRYMESALYGSGGGGGGGTQFFCGSVPSALPPNFVAFVDSNGSPYTTGVPPAPIVVQNPPPADPNLPADGTVISGFTCGFIQVGAAQTRSKVSDDAVGSSPQTYTGIEGGGGTFVDDSFGQGIVWGIPQ